MNSTLREPLIYLITKGDLTAENFREKIVETLAVVEKSVRAGVSLVQLREKLLSARLLFELASEASKLTKNSCTKLLVNDRADVALAAGADGVHLTSQSVRAETVRANFPGNFIVGVSAHSPAEVADAKRAGADFATFSPVFATPSKIEYGAPQGVAKLREAAQTVESFPVIALGGIDANNFREALKAGARGVAAIRFFGDAENLGEIVGEIRQYRNE